MIDRGLLILFEGLDRSGKSTQVQKLGSVLDCVVFKFPGNKLRLTLHTKLTDLGKERSTPIGNLINDFLERKLELEKHAAHLLFVANRWEMQTRIVNALESGKHVVMDRYSYSGIAYAQAGISEQWTRGLEHNLLQPDIVFFMDIPPEVAANRKGYGTEKFEVIEFQNNTREKFKQFQSSVSDWNVIDANQTPEEIHQQVLEKLKIKFNETRAPIKFQSMISE